MESAVNGRQWQRDDDDSDRAKLLRTVLSDCRLRRMRGENLPDELVISSHVELMPELEHELLKLRVVQEARQRAERLPISGDSELGSDESTGPRFGGYDVVRELHRGGQGIVYQAIQRSTQRKVAIKLFSGGAFIDARSKARWQREIRILAQLDHPNIVKIHDGGTSNHGPYYVMDYVAGEPLDVFVEQRRLMPAEIVALFIKIGEAVHATHMRGVIHRDLKPDNIRVTEYGEPFILDFGLARIAADALTDDPSPELISMTGQFIGTVAWASPEQAAGRVGVVDLRTDVFALGLILYKAIIGQMPYDITGSARDVLDRVIRCEPRRPRELSPSLDEDLETILLKCLEKDPSRRYASAAMLISDLRHYLQGEPIEARRANAFYSLRRALRRYRTVVSTVAAFALVVLVFAITMATMYRRAEYEADKAERVATFLENVLSAVDPVVAHGRDAAFLREALDQAAAQVSALGDIPEAEARVRHTIGQTYLRLGMYGEAQTQLKVAYDLRAIRYGSDSTETAATAEQLAETMLELEDYSQAAVLFEQALAVRERLSGRDRLLLAETLDGIGHLYFVKGDYALAEKPLREALRLRRELDASPVELAQSLANVGSLLRNQLKYQEAEPLLREALAICHRELGPEHVHTIMAMNKLMILLKMRGDYEAALAIGSKALELRKRVYGEHHPHVGVSQFNLARTFVAAGDDASAVPHFREAAAIWQAAYPAGHSDATRAIADLAGCLTRLRRFVESEKVLLDCHQELQEIGCTDAEQLHRVVCRLIELYEVWDRPQEAARWRDRLPPPLNND